MSVASCAIDPSPGGLLGFYQFPPAFRMPGLPLSHGDLNPKDLNKRYGFAPN